MNLSLVMFKSDGTRRDFPVTKDRVVIGRKPSCDLRIPLSSVSRQHCEIRMEGDKAVVCDLGSSNGTFHNSVRIQEQELAAGDALIIGPVVFTVVIDGQPEEIEPVHSYLDERGEDGSGHATQEQPAHDGADLGQGSAEFPAHTGEEESFSPTADLDDPLAALERMAAAEDDSRDVEFGNPANDEDQQQAQAQNPLDEDDGLELLGDEDEIEPEPKQSKGKRRNR